VLSVGLGVPLPEAMVGEWWMVEDIGNGRCGDVGIVLSNERRVLRLCDGGCLVVEASRFKLRRDKTMLTDRYDGLVPRWWMEEGLAANGCDM